MGWDADGTGRDATGWGRDGMGWDGTRRGGDATGWDGMGTKSAPREAAGERQRPADGLVKVVHRVERRCAVLSELAHPVVEVHREITHFVGCCDVPTLRSVPANVTSAHPSHI
jgi:hypothetical protein